MLDRHFDSAIQFICTFFFFADFTELWPFEIGKVDFSICKTIKKMIYNAFFKHELYRDIMRMFKNDFPVFFFIVIWGFFSKGWKIKFKSLCRPQCISEWRKFIWKVYIHLITMNSHLYR